MGRKSTSRARKGVIFASLALLAIALPFWLVGDASSFWGIQSDGPSHGPEHEGPPLVRDMLQVQRSSMAAAGVAVPAGKADAASRHEASTSTVSPPAPAAAEKAASGESLRPEREASAPVARAASGDSLRPEREASGEPLQLQGETSTTGLPDGSDMEGRLDGKWFGWCHDGKQRNGQFWFLKGGKTKGDLTGWGLKCWEVTGPLQVTLHDCARGNKHVLTFNCGLTGYYCKNGGQRGFQLSGGGGVTSPEDVAAPTSAEIPNCFNPEVGRITTLRPVATRSDCNIFTLWDYPDGAPLFARLNLESWRRHSHGLCNEPILINDRNVMTYIPDMPEEYFRLPYVAAKSDAIRYALLYHHGGIYFDSDFIVVEDLDPIIKMLETTDLVSYDHNTRGGGDACGAKFSSNFMGGRRGSIMHGATWEAQKELMVKHCPLKDKTKEKVCCFEDVTEVCHIPWAGLGEWVSHAQINELNKQGKKPSTYCYKGDKSFVPDNLGKVLGDRLSPDVAEKLIGGSRMGLKRMMYHLFNAQYPFKDYTCEALFDNKTAASYLYLRSYRIGHGGQRAPLTQATEDLFTLHPTLRQHDADYGGGRPCRYKREPALPWTRLADAAPSEARLPAKGR